MLLLLLRPTNAALLPLLERADLSLRKRSTQTDLQCRAATTALRARGAKATLRARTVRTALRGRRATLKLD